MKRYIRKLVCFVLSLTMIFTVTVPQQASAAGYSVNAAMAYAQAHWDDGVGMCAEFVSKCIIAGGINMSVKLQATACFETAQKATGLDGIELRLNSGGYATRELDGDILQAGDIVIQTCKTHYTNPHIMICGGYSARGYATFYGHTGEINNEEQILNVNTAYEHTTACDMRAKVLHLSALSSDNYGGGSTGGSGSGLQSPAVTVYANGADSITENNAIVRGSCTKSSGTKITSCGVYIGESISSMTKSAPETPSSGANAKNGGTGFDIWYNIVTELGITLKPGTTYCYRFYCVAGGTEYQSGISEFRTQGSAPAPAPTQAPVPTQAPIPSQAPAQEPTPTPAEKIGVQSTISNGAAIKIPAGYKVPAYKEVTDKAPSAEFAAPEKDSIWRSASFCSMEDGSRRFAIITAEGVTWWIEKTKELSVIYYATSLKTDVSAVKVKTGEEFTVICTLDGIADMNEPVYDIDLKDKGYFTKTGNTFKIVMTEAGEYEINFFTPLSYLIAPVRVSVEGTEVSATPSPTPDGTPDSSVEEFEDRCDILSAGNRLYGITAQGSKTVKLISDDSKTASVVVPSTIKANGITYKVTEIGEYAFANNPKLKSVTIGANVTKISAKAFAGSSKLKTVVIGSKRLKKIGSGAFKGISSNAVFVCPATKLSAYKKLIKATKSYKKTMKIVTK